MFPELENRTPEDPPVEIKDPLPEKLRNSVVKNEVLFFCVDPTLGCFELLRVKLILIFAEGDSSFRPRHVSPHGCDHLRHQCQHRFHRSPGELELSSCFCSFSNLKFLTRSGTFYAFQKMFFFFFASPKAGAQLRPVHPGWSSRLHYALSPASAPQTVAVVLPGSPGAPLQRVQSV